MHVFKFLGLWVLLALACFANEAEPEARDLRGKALKLDDSGNWKEALEIRLELLKKVNDEKSGKDLKQVADVLAKALRLHELDALLADTCAAHPQNWSLHYEAGVILQNVHSRGRKVDGVFQRGASTVKGYTPWIYVTEQDRMQALRYLHTALALAQDEMQKMETLRALREAVLKNRTGLNRYWALQLKSDLSVIPEENANLSSGSGLPVDKHGAPLYFDIPASWELAQSDGERLRWLNAEMVKVNPYFETILAYEWAAFCVQHYGVQTLTTRGRSQEQGDEGDLFQIETLKDDETLAKLANGVARFELRKDYQFIPQLRELMQISQDGSGSMAGDLLVKCYLKRRQFVSAAATLQELIKVHGEFKPQKKRAQLLKQITGNWGTFGNAPTFISGQKVAVPFVYRNASSVQLTLYQVNYEKVIEDSLAYLESNPGQVDYWRLDFNSVGSMIIKNNRREYLGGEIAKWSTELTPNKQHQDVRTELLVPTAQKAGAYLLEATLPDGNTSWIVVWLSDLFFFELNSEGSKHYYLSEADTGKAVSGKVEFFGYNIQRLDKKATTPEGRFQTLTHRQEFKTDAQGHLALQSKKLKKDFRYFVFASVNEAKGKGNRLAMLQGAERLYWRSHKANSYRQPITFGITDRPAYRPGQKVYCKFFTNEARYDHEGASPYANKPCVLQIRDAKGEEILVKNLRLDENGSLEFDFQLEEEASLGRYTVKLYGNNKPKRFLTGSLNFQVEEYKKPEFEVHVEAPQKPITLGQKFTAKLHATYYHGAPVTNAQAKITVRRHSHDHSWFPSGPWDWLYGKGYAWPHSPAIWHPSWRDWGCRRPSAPWHSRSRHTPHELIAEKTIDLKADGTCEIEIDTAPAKLVHGDLDHRYEITAEVTDASRRMIRSAGSVLAARVPFKVTTWLDRGFAKVGDKATVHYSARTLDGQRVTGQSTATLYHLNIAANGNIEETPLTTFLIKEEGNAINTSGEGRFPLHFEKPGQYRVVVSHQSNKASPLVAPKPLKGGSIFLVLPRNQADRTKDLYRFDPIELTLDKKEYKPGDIAKILLTTNALDSRVWLFLRKDAHGTPHEVRIIKLNGQVAEIDLPLTLADMPNIFVEAITIRDGKLHRANREIVLPPAKRLLQVEVEPAKHRLQPREKSSLLIRLKDSEGNPYQGQAVLAIYDKSLEYISGGTNIPNINKHFWGWKRHYRTTPLRHSDFLSDYSRNLSRKNTERMRFFNFFRRDGNSNHDPFGGGEDESLGGGASFFGSAIPRSKSRNLLASAAAPSSSLANVVNSEREGLDKGFAPDAPLLIRSEFADLLKWSGNLTTDKNGEALVDLDMPDNLTTWKANVWAMGQGSRVGEGSAEFITSKDLIVRLQAPRFFIETDEVTLSAIVHNAKDTAKEVTVSLEIDGDSLRAQGQPSSTLTIPAHGEQRLDWTVTAQQEGEVTVRMKALATDGSHDSDAMEMTFPVHVHGIAKTESWSRAIVGDAQKTVIDFTVPAKRRPTETRLEVRYSPSIATAMVDALPYLADYPYGCTEQTLNRFVPTVVIQKLLTEMGIDLLAIKNKKTNLNPQEIGNAQERAAQWKGKGRMRNPVWDNEDVNKMTRAGIQRLAKMQNSDGGWGWFNGFGERSYPHTTAVVLHGLNLAKENGSKVPAEMLTSGKAWLQKYETTETEKIKHYPDLAGIPLNERKGKDRTQKIKAHPSALDAFVRFTLGEADHDNSLMLGYLHRDKNDLPTYAKALLGLEHHRKKEHIKRDAVLRNIEQHLKLDPENQSAYLELGNQGYWWHWYGSEIEAHAWYLKLLALTKPNSPQARGLAKYLLNNRKHGSYWNSTRDTSYALEALATYLRHSKESDPTLEVEVLLDGKPLKTVTITKENLFTFDGSVLVAGDILTTGKHQLELRKKGGDSPLYTNAYLSYFTKEDHLTKAGLEIKVERTYYKLSPENIKADLAGSQGQALTQTTQKLRRQKLNNGDTVQSGDLIEVELRIESKNDYEYLLFADWKPAGCESTQVRSGYTPNELGAYMELRDEQVALFVRSLPRGKHSLSYRLRAEIPGTFSALPTQAQAMYAPELRANSDELKIQISE